jgi:DNA-binding NarL/FixJ family response regulator
VIRVFLVDDHHFFLSGLRAELGAEFEIVGEAGEVDAAVDGIRRTRPDVVLLDVHLPGGGGRAVLEAVRQTDQEIRFLALSVSDAAEDVIGVIRAGARGYVTKTISPPTWPPPSAGSRAATPCSPPAWPGSCSTPSTAT